MGYDFDEYSLRKRHQLEEISPGVYLMDSRVPVSEANEVLGLSDRAVVRLRVESVVVALSGRHPH